MTRGPRPITPPATIGILGGGQLGRMTALAARAMGYCIHVLDPDPACSAAPVADRCITARFDDVDAARDLARHCDVVTIEIEQIATDVIDAANAYAPTRPAAAVIGMVQDRARQKSWLVEHEFPVAPWKPVATASELDAAIRELGDVFVKSCRGGYDGRSQFRVQDESRAGEAWKAVGARPSVAERTLNLAAELSVMAARRPSGQVVAFPVALNHHERHVLAWSALPAPLPPAVTDRATEIACDIAEQLRLEGLIAVEMFLTNDGDLIVNELAPRPHNSYHASERACVTTQFEQLVRAVCDLPLGDVGILRPAAIVNLFGDLWHNGTQPPFERALSVPGARVHLYGKGDPRPARKMGHVSAVGGSPLDALAAARRAAAELGVRTGEPPSVASH